MSLRTQNRHLRSHNIAQSIKISSLYIQIRNFRVKNRILQSKVTALELEAERLRIESFTDPLTGLYNRSGLRHVWREISGDVTGFMVLDSDLFKQVNDRYGHSVGDIVLCYVGETMRGYGIISARTGGDEFVGLITDADPEKVAEQLRCSIAAPRMISGNKITTTATIGLCHIDQYAPMITYFEKADEALYQGKRRGRNTLTVTRLGDQLA